MADIMKCLTCGFMSPDGDSDPACKNKKQCDVRKVACIHLVAPEGKGVTLGNTKRIVTDDEKSKAINVPLNLCCDYIPNRGEIPLHTDQIHAATCPDCLATINNGTNENV